MLVSFPDMCIRCENWKGESALRLGAIACWDDCYAACICVANGCMKRDGFREVSAGGGVKLELTTS